MTNVAALHPAPSRTRPPRSELVHALVDYYAPDGDSCGVSFLDGTETEFPDTVVPGDLFAVTMLGLDVPSAGARRLLHDTPHAQRVAARLAALPPDATLLEADAGLFDAMLELHDAVLTALDPRTAEGIADRVIASAVCARKRPELFPVLEPGFCGALGLPGPARPVQCWQAIRLLLAQEAESATLYADAGTAAPGLRFDVYPLRRLQVLVALDWTPTGW